MKPGFLRKLVLSVPLGIDPKRYFLCLLGPVMLGLSVGIQVTTTAFLCLGPVDGAKFADQLTEYGRRTARPEHDLVIYLAGVLLVLLLIWVAVQFWRGKLANMEAEKAPGFMMASALLEGVLAAMSMISYALLVCSGWFARDFRITPSIRPPTSGADAVLLLVPALMALVCAAVDLKFGFGEPVKTGNRFTQWRLRLGKLLRYAVPVFIILVVGVPPGAWRYLAGDVLATDWCHHLNFFMMGPAMAFAHGKAFGTEIYSQYGIGWPLLASLLSRFSLLTYGNLVGLEVVSSCVYCVALFFLLWSCFKQELWAVFGVVLAIYWQLFSGGSPGEVIWQYPSTTMMRHPMDVWFFLALVMHQRSGRLFWALAAGLAAGLGVFFETETGIYLLVTFLIYSVLQAGLAAGKRRGGAKGWLLPPLAFYATAAVTLLPLLLYASRGALFTGAFWHGWAEALFAYAGQGVGALPIAELPDTPLMVFLVMVAVYLGVIAYVALRALHESASEGEVLLAALAAYGLALLLLFVNRSHPFNLCHATPPFAVLVTALLFRGHRALASRQRRSSLPYSLTFGLIALLLTKSTFLDYPSILSSLFGARPRGGLSLVSNPSDLSGLPEQQAAFIKVFNDLAAAIRILAPDGKGVAVLDPYDTVHYYAAKVEPWGRYAPLFNMVLTPQFLQDLQNRLINAPPKYVVTRGQQATRLPRWEFVWVPLYQIVTNRYELVQTVGPFEIWALPQNSRTQHRAADH